MEQVSVFNKDFNMILDLEREREINKVEWKIVKSHIT